MTEVRLGLVFGRSRGTGPGRITTAIARRAGKAEGREKAEGDDSDP
jgi:hypothetical protein